MDTLIPALLRRQRNQRRLTLEMLSAKVGPLSFRVELTLPLKSGDCATSFL